MSRRPFVTVRTGRLRTGAEPSTILRPEDGGAVVRCDHRFSMWRFEFLLLRYRIAPDRTLRAAQRPLRATDPGRTLPGVRRGALVQSAGKARTSARLDPRSHGEAQGILHLQATAGNHAVTALLGVQRDKTGSPMDPRKFDTYGRWLAALPSGAVDEKTVDITDDVGKSLPDLSTLVRSLKADCADVTILLKHYYYGAHGKTIRIPAQTDTKPRKRIHFDIGAGVDHDKLRTALVQLGTIHFQDMRKADRIITYYGGGKPLTNLAKIMEAGLEPGDVLVWKKLAGVKGNFSGHIQTVQRIWHGSSEFGRWEIEVLQGTLEGGKAKGQLQSKKLSSFLLTGRSDGEGPITYKPDGEERFYGAGKW